jgi:hypothetical protein
MTPSDRIACILFAILFGGCCLAFLAMAIADKLDARRRAKPRPTVNVPKIWPKA